MKHINLLLMLIITVGRLFVFDQNNIEPTQRDMNEWVKDKKVVSVTQSSGGWKDYFYTCITIIAEEED